MPFTLRYSSFSQRRKQYLFEFPASIKHSPQNLWPQFVSKANIRLFRHIEHISEALGGSIFRS